MTIRLAWDRVGAAAAESNFRVTFCCDVCGDPITDVLAANYLFDTRTREGRPRVFVVHRLDCLEILASTMTSNGGRPGWLDLELLPGQLLNGANLDAFSEYVLLKRPRAQAEENPDAATSH